LVSKRASDNSLHWRRRSRRGRIKLDASIRLTPLRSGSARTGEDDTGPHDMSHQKSGTPRSWRGRPCPAAARQVTAARAASDAGQLLHPHAASCKTVLGGGIPTGRALPYVASALKPASATSLRYSASRRGENRPRKAAGMRLPSGRPVLAAPARDHVRLAYA
jgi:hypothetical protein